MLAHWLLILFLTNLISDCSKILSCFILGSKNTAILYISSILILLFIFCSTTYLTWVKISSSDILALQWSNKVLYHGIIICNVGYLDPFKNSLASRNFLKNVIKLCNIFRSIFSILFSSSFFDSKSFKSSSVK